MKTKLFFVPTPAAIVIPILAALALILFSPPQVSVAAEQQALRVSTSAQIASVIGQSGFDAFERETGIKLEVFACSSEAAIHRLMYGHCEIAGTMEELPFDQEVYGYVLTRICTDPLAVITNSAMSVENLTVFQLQQIFSGQILNWKEIGGPDQPITVVIPSKETAAYKNFDRRVMRYRKPKYDLMAYKSTHIIEVVAKFPYSISFISQGAAWGNAAVKSLQVGGQPVTGKDYPFQQEIAFVTKGEPAGKAKRFIDYWRSGKGLDLLKQKGMVPAAN